MVNLKDIARECGVSIKTVSNVVNNAPNVGEATRGQVQDAIRRLGYIPSRAARGLVLGVDVGQPARFHSGYNVGCLLRRGISRYSDSYYSSVFSGIEWELRRNGHFLLFAQSIDELESNPVLMNTLLNPQSIDGLLSFAKDGRDFLVRHLSPSTPVVSIGEVDGLECVVTDKDQAIRLSLEHLTGLGHRKIGFFGFVDKMSGRYEPRFASFLAEAPCFGVETKPEWHLGRAFGFEGGYAAAKELLTKASLPTAVVCTSDMTAIGAIHAFHESGVKIPGEISVIGYDNIPEAEAVYPKLTTIAVDRDGVGATAVDMLLSRIAKPAAPYANRLLPVKLVVRNSTAHLSN